MERSNDTHERLLSPGEITMLLKFSVETNETIDTLICSCDDRFISKVQKMLSGEGVFHVKRTGSGCDTLFECARKIPDLLIIDDRVDDIPCSKVIGCIKRTEELNSIKILCMGDSQSGTEQHTGADAYLAKTDADRDHFVRTLQTLAGETYRQAQSSRPDAVLRAWPRATVNITARIEMVNVNDPEEQIEGEALIENISHCGAFLSRLKLDRTLIPDGSYRLRLHVDQSPLKNLSTESIVVRLCAGDEQGAGVKFVNISEKDKIKILKLFKS